MKTFFFNIAMLFVLLSVSNAILVNKIFEQNTSEIISNICIIIPKLLLIISVLRNIFISLRTAMLNNRKLGGKIKKSVSFKNIILYVLLLFAINNYVSCFSDNFIINNIILLVVSFISIGLIKNNNIFYKQVKLKKSDIVLIGALMFILLLVENSLDGFIISFIFIIICFIISTLYPEKFIGFIASFVYQYIFILFSRELQEYIIIIYIGIFVVYWNREREYKKERLKNIQLSLISSKDMITKSNVFRANFIYNFIEQDVYKTKYKPEFEDSASEYETIKKYQENSGLLSNDISNFKFGFYKYNIDIYTYCDLQENMDISNLKNCMETGLFLIVSNESPNMEDIVFKLIDKVNLVCTSLMYIDVRTDKYKVPVMIMVNKDIFSASFEDSINKLQANDSIFADREKAVDFLCRGTLLEICDENINALNLLDNNFANLHFFVYSDEPTETIHTAVFKSMLVSGRKDLYNTWKVKKGLLPKTSGNYIDIWSKNKGNFIDLLK